MLFRFGKELFWTIAWVFIALIVGYIIMNFLISKNVPLLGGVSQWVESHSNP